jgi:hypothetical protein
VDGVRGHPALVPSGSDGAVSAFVTDQTNLILDIDGLFAP